jgi:hypothetical protein
MQTDVRELLARMQICHVEVNGLLDVPHEGEGGHCSLLVGQGSGRRWAKLGAALDGARRARPSASLSCDVRGCRGGTPDGAQGDAREAVCG